MIQPNEFASALEAVEQLDEEAQAELIAIIGHRLAERGRQRIIETITQSRKEYAAGEYKVMTADEIMKDALS